MTAQVSSRERREVMATARRYRRDGYKVSGPDRWDGRPSFLGDIVPDLIAEREDDKVVIEIKEAAAVRGSNEIVDLAARIEQQPGWRFELIAIRSIDDRLKPDLAWGGDNAERMMQQGFMKPAFILVYAMIENVIANAAARQKRQPKSSPQFLKDLVVNGVIDQQLYDGIRVARGTRNILLSNRDEPEPARTDIETLLQLASTLAKEVSIVEQV